MKKNLTEKLKDLNFYPSEEKEDAWIKEDIISDKDYLDNYYDIPEKNFILRKKRDEEHRKPVCFHDGEEVVKYSLTKDVYEEHLIKKDTYCKSCNTLLNQWHYYQDTILQLYSPKGMDYSTLKRSCRHENTQLWYDSENNISEEYCPDCNTVIYACQEGVLDIPDRGKILPNIRYVDYSTLPDIDDQGNVINDNEWSNKPAESIKWINENPVDIVADLNGVLEDNHCRCKIPPWRLYGYDTATDYVRYREQQERTKRYNLCTHSSVFYDFDPVYRVTETVCHCCKEVIYATPL